MADKTLADVRAELAELKAKSEARAEGTEAEQLEALNRELADARAIDKAETELGPVGKRILAVHTDLGVVIVKRPAAPTYKRFQDEAKTTTESLEKLVRGSLVHPDAATFDRIVDELPATLARVANAVCALAGVRAEEVAGK
jgi:hypothetical protein